MPAVHELSRADARRIAVRAQLLAKDRPSGLLETIRHLTLLQLEPTNAIAPTADLVLWSRLGSAYDPRELRDAIDQIAVVDLRGELRPAEDIALFTAEMAAWPGTGTLRDWQEGLRDWMTANNACREDILARLRSDGPLPSKELPDTCVTPWMSSGWNDNRNVRMMLSQLVQRGEVAAAGRDGRDQLWDLAERIYPDDPPVPIDEALCIRARRRLRALGIARPKGTQVPGEPYYVGDAGEPAVVDGTRGEWRVDPAQLGQPFEGRAALLSPFDRLVVDRKRLDDVFEFDYLLEMYKPAAQRMWGYYALPILYGDRLVGKLDAKAERDAGVLRINAIHEDVPFTKTMTKAVQREIDGLARWLDLDVAMSE
jgi:uncharacterized protein YcaQ